MPTVDDLSDRRDTDLRDIEDLTVSQLVAAWDLWDPADPQATFVGGVLPAALPAVIIGQEYAAEVGGVFIAGAAVELDVPPGPPIAPVAFSGIASSGRDLVKLLVQPLIGAKIAALSGADRTRVIDVGRQSMAAIGSTQVHDAARAAEQVAMVTTTQITGHVRKVESGACSRCIVLSGRFYRWSKGFDRHPGCRCSMWPVTNDVELPLPSPQETFDSLTVAEQDGTFGAAGAQAIRDGADPVQVVNARRGMVTPGGQRSEVKYTLEGTTRRGYYAFQRRAIDDLQGTPTGETVENVGRRGAVASYRVRRVAAPRLMPEGIYRQAAGDRDEAYRLLIGNGYVIGDLRAQAAQFVARTPAAVPLG